MMTPLTHRDVLAHQYHVPWPTHRQVEQDLLLCRSMAAIFGDPFLQGQLAMRGGTLLHKVHLAPPSRYSEDIDLVVYGDRPEDHITKALRRVLGEVLGKPKTSVWDVIQLAIRNAVKPSRVLRLTYEVPSVREPGRTLTVVIEINVTERQPFRPIVEMPFEFPFRDTTTKTLISGYDIHEMLGTKMRALFQRRRGRDLFDLYWALTQANPAVDPATIIESFEHYLLREGSKATRAEWIGLLDSYLADRGFCSDMEPLLRVGLQYDPHQAGEYVKNKLLILLP